MHQVFEERLLLEFEETLFSLTAEMERRRERRFHVLSTGFWEQTIFQQTDM